VHSFIREFLCIRAPVVGVAVAQEIPLQCSLDGDWLEYRGAFRGGEQFVLIVGGLMLDSRLRSRRVTRRLNYDTFDKFGFYLPHSTPRPTVDSVSDMADIHLQDGSGSATDPDSDDDLSSLEAELKTLNDRKLSEAKAAKKKMKQQLLMEISEGKASLKGKVAEPAAGKTGKDLKKKRHSTLLNLEDLRAMKMLDKKAS
jgi:hypothetical protein